MHLLFSITSIEMYFMSDQKPYIEEQTTQWPKEKVQKDKQRSTKHTYKTKDRVTPTPLKTERGLMCSGKVSSSCSTSTFIYFMLGICAFVANLIKKYKKWKVVASGFYGVRVAHLFSFLYCAVCLRN
jgi:hypothetical protein